FSYSDRPVYRPGDTVHYKAVVRKKENGEYIVPKGTLYLQVSTDYLSSSTSDDYAPVSIDDDGTVIFDAKLPKTQSSYTIITLLSKNDAGEYQQIDSFPVTILSYRKPDMDITATAAQKEYVSSDSAHFTVLAKTNYGQPLSNTPFSYRVLLTDYSEIKDRTRENVEAMVSGYYGYGQPLASGSGTFDDKGVGKITFSTSLPSNFEQSQIATLEITPNIGAAPSIGKIAKLIHRGEFAMFIDNVNVSNSKEISGSVTVLDHASPRQPVANQQVELSLYKIIDYQNKQFVISQSVVSLQDGAVNFSFPDAAKGSYEIVARSVDTRSNTVVALYSVYVGDRQALQQTQQYTLTATAQKSTYNASETATIAISANFTVNEAVVIVTNANIGSSHIVSLAKNTIGQTSWSVSVPIKEAYGDQLGIDVFSVQNGSVNFAHTNIDIVKEEKRIVTSIDFDKKTYTPGDKASVTITTTDAKGNPVASDTSLSVIDASILQIGQLNGDIYETFYSRYPLYTTVSHFDSTTGIYTDLAGGGGCFLAGTKIAMSDGTSKNIEDVQVGDTILTRESDTSQKLVQDTVVKTFRHAVTDFLTINGMLHVTPVHRIFVNGEWREAKDARIGDTLLGLNGNSITITSITPNKGQFLVYNLSTQRYHTFFADGLYVHNDKGEGLRQNFADTAYWNPHIKTNADGKATISFTLPDNLTTFTAQAFAHSKDSQFGQATASVVSEKMFTIIPAISQFYYEEDKPEISALLQNSSQNDVDANVSLTVKELGYSKNAATHIAKGDIFQVVFPIALKGKTKSVSFLIEAKDNSGVVLDSLKLTRPILPKGKIMPFWTSFTGSKQVDFLATHPMLDVNKVTVTIAPNIVAKLFENNAYLSLQPSINTGKSIYTYAYVLAKTKNGLISPVAYQYASLKNDFREQISNLLRARNTVWTTQYYQNESYIAMNLWLAQGLTQAATVGELDEIGNIASIVQDVKQYIRTTYPQTGGNGQANILNFNEQMVWEWVLNEQVSDTPYKDSLLSLSIQAFNGTIGALDNLRSARVISADDRYIWDGDATEAQIFPALAMIEKGSIRDAEKAIKGLSFTNYKYTLDPLAILAGVKFAEKTNIYVDKPRIHLTVNGETLYETKKERFDGNVMFTLLPKNTEDGKLTFAVETQGDVPVYTTVVQTDFQADAGKETFGDAKVLDIPITRSFKDIQTGKDISEIKQGQSGAVVLSMQNIFSGYQNREYGYDAKYAFTLEDAILPSYMFLSQLGEGSPQYQSELSKLFPGQSEYQRAYTAPSDYTDEEVIFSGSSSEPTIILSYVVYAISNGTHYQPKTSIVFPVLGVIASER
ncbi:MAG: hypothetical protein HY429_00635, partial [Candidatus Levybacteria bacterium]|nr:hypothetical protein [Candidatus Levybacteria bacterium]